MSRLQSAPEWLPLAQQMREEGWILREIAASCNSTTGNVDYWLNHEERQERRGERKPVFIYFVQADWGGPIKIGYGTAHRLANLRSASPDDLVVRRRIDCSDRENAQRLEADLHKNFATHRIRGEWFRPSVGLCKMANAKPNADRYDLADAYGASFEREQQRKLTGDVLREAFSKGKAAGFIEGYEEAKDEQAAENLRRIA